MQAAVQLVARQIGWLAFFLFLFALAQGWYVCEGLWQGIGLHGYVIHYGRAHQGITVSIWAAFLQALVLAGAAGMFACIALWHKRHAPRVETRGGSL